jgi:sperm-associated antigen 16 protein
MSEELKQAKVKAELAKSTWDKLRKERDFHKGHQDRVNREKVDVAKNIKTVKDNHRSF